MTRSQVQIANQLGAARAGSAEALGGLLEDCRRYLLRVANRRIDPALRAKGGASDVVQQTFLEAHQAFARFQGSSEKELLAWLRQLLLNHLANFHRLYRGTDKRQVSRETPAEQGGPSTEGSLAGDASSPSRQAMRQEECEALTRALERLPEEQRRVIVLRHQEQYSFEEIGRCMNRSASGARLLWTRALDQLHKELDNSP
jgi:RNA polymerase sigma-70 factor (ECF subfamily)